MPVRGISSAIPSTSATSCAACSPGSTNIWGCSKSFSPTGCGLIGASVIVHNAPALRKFPEYQREDSVRLLPVGHAQMKRAPHERAVPAEQLDVQIGKLQMPQ